MKTTQQFSTAEIILFRLYCGKRYLLIGNVPDDTHISSSSAGGNLNSLMTCVQFQYSPFIYWFSNHPDAMLVNVCRTELWRLFNCIAIFWPTDRYLPVSQAKNSRKIFLEMVFVGLGKKGAIICNVFILTSVYASIVFEFASSYVYFGQVSQFIVPTDCGHSRSRIIARRLPHGLLISPFIVYINDGGGNFPSEWNYLCICWASRAEPLQIAQAFSFSVISKLMIYDEIHFNYLFLALLYFIE